MTYTVFLDRDGVVNADSEDYIRTPAQFQFIPGSPEAVALLKKNGFKVILITNQSIIGRNMATPDMLDAIFEKMNAGFKQAGGQLDDIFFCPHTPDDNCSCRKPGPGMILEAVDRHGIDLSHAMMIGDSAKDIECALNAGCAKTVLVRTGNGKSAQAALAGKGIVPDYIADDLYAAARWAVRFAGT